MKPHKIVMQAFGPYLNATEIDFTKLYSYGLFLITGSTGCGKTTILDAMSYALYGRSSGSLRDARDMRCIAAPDTLETRVSFEMELGGDLYKFERGMKIRAIKKRSGETERTTDYEESCYNYDGEKWRLLCTGPQVRDKAVELLGFSHDQFSQVIVLPQGEFRRLLTAPSLEKQKILETLFGTVRWQNFSKALALRSKSIDAALSQCVERTATLCKSVECENREELGARLSQKKDELQAVETGMKALVAAFDAASAAFRDASTLEQKFSELDAARERQKQLALMTDEIGKKRQSLEKAEKALGVMPYLDALTQAQKTLDAAQKELESAQSGLAAAQKEEQNAQTTLDGSAKAEASLKELAGTIARLEGILEPSRALCKAQKELLIKRQEQRSALACAEKEALRVEQFTAALENLKTKIKENSERYVLRLPELVTQRTELAARVDAFAAFEAQKKTVTALDSTLEKKRNEYKALSQSHKNEKQIYENMQKAIDGDAAYRLAQELCDGEKCPVCGSDSHPIPAAAVCGAPTREELEIQKKIVESLEEKLNVSGEEGARIRGEHDSAAKRLAELEAECEKFGSSAAEAQAQLSSVKKSLEEAQTAAKRQPQMEAEAKNAEAELTKAKANFDSLKVQADTAALSVSALEGRVAQLADAVPEKMRDAAAVEEQITTLKKSYEITENQIKETRTQFESARSALAAATERLRSSTNTKSAAEENCKAAANEFEKRREQSEIPQGSDIKALVLNETARGSLKEEIEGFDRETLLQNDRAAALEKQLAESQRPNTQALKEIEAKARDEMEKSLSQKGAFAASIKNFESVSTQLAQTAEQEEKLRRNFSLYDHVYRLTGGENPLKTPIHQFVLGLMLDDIVASANIHLSQLSRGRYSLVRSNTPGRGNGTKGLDLSVGDAWSGGERGVNTLSGGEMFLASLSLAFGLSDVVQAYAGGIRLDSLFIDEGFGSLDAETLDTAMGALERLRLSGRLIGVISHVGELRERIPAHINVKRQADGTAGAAVITP
jgi:DNA repair protein SbcC/Rad50